MPKASPMPRKHKSTIDDVQSSLRKIGDKVRLELKAIEFGPHSPEKVHKLKSLLREIETEAYRLSLMLREIEIAENCDACPAAPPTTRAQAHLYIVADELARLSELTREAAEASTRSARGSSV